MPRRFGAPSALLMIVAVVLFLLAAFGADIGDLSEADLVALGLAFFAAGHVI